MICQDCGFKNPSDAKYCIQCGHRLKSESLKECANCGNPNPKEYQFCINCGNRLSETEVTKTGVQKKKKKKKSKKSPKSDKASISKKNEYILYSLLSVFIMVLLFIAIMNRNSAENSPTQKINIMELSNRDPLTEANLIAVANKFQCSCGSCDDTSLESCQCPTAEQERQFIREALQQGHSVKETITLVKNKFGWIKPEYQSEFN